MYSVIGKKEFSYLLADPQGADVIAIPCEPGNGVIKRGTVMVRKDTGLWAPAAAADIAETKMLCVIDEAVDTTLDAKVAEDARAYRAGRLIYGKVILAAGTALTAANLIVLRKQGLVFDRMEETSTFDNEKKEQAAGGGG